MKMQNSCKGSKQKAGEKMGEVIVSMKDIVKTFPGVKALDHVNFDSVPVRSWHFSERTERGNPH